MISINYQGRLGNNLFQFAAASIFANKFKIKLTTNPVVDIFKLNQDQQYASFKNEKLIEVNDDNFLSLLSSESVEPCHYRFNGFFQIKDFVISYAEEIRSLFKINHTIEDSNEVFVVYRIGDIEGSRRMLPLEFYQEAIERIGPKGGYITSDSPTHPNVVKLSNQFNLKVYENSPINTILFAKNFSNIVLSEGSFSWWIGFLSNSQNIYYNERERFWHGDIFVFPEWKKLNYDFK